MPPSPGRIEVICGCMFSGKTEELMRRLRRARIARQDVRVFKPALDDRYAATYVVSHEGGRLPCTPLPTAQHILAEAEGVDVIGIDEAQFFGPDVVEVAETLARRGLRVVVAGLDMDFRAQPFGPMPALLSIAEDITKLSAICAVCAADAHFSYRFTDGADTVLVGAAGHYEPRCRRCFTAGAAAQRA